MALSRICALDACLTEFCQQTVSENHETVLQCQQYHKLCRNNNIIHIHSDLANKSSETVRSCYVYSANDLKGNLR